MKKKKEKITKKKNKPVYRKYESKPKYRKYESPMYDWSWSWQRSLFELRLSTYSLEQQFGLCRRKLSCDLFVVILISFSKVRQSLLREAPWPAPAQLLRVLRGVLEPSPPAPTVRTKALPFIPCKGTKCLVSCFFMCFLSILSTQSTKARFPLSLVLVKVVFQK